MSGARETATGSIEPTSEQFKALASSDDEGPIVMVNLLRFKQQADGIDAGVSGAEAYARYGEAVAPFLERVGGRLLAGAACEQSLIGPAAAEWDLVVLVSYPSRKAFIEMTTDPGYLEIHAHRVAALADSRLIVSKSLPAAEADPAKTDPQGGADGDVPNT